MSPPPTALRNGSRVRMPGPLASLNPDRSRDCWAERLDSTTPGTPRQPLAAGARPDPWLGIAPPTGGERRAMGYDDKAGADSSRRPDRPRPVRDGVAEEIR